MGRVLLLAVLLLFVPLFILAQDISTDVYPSVDELLAALDDGEITIEQYVLLSELMLLSPDVFSPDLLKEFPNFIQSIDSQYLSTSHTQSIMPGDRQLVSGSWRYGYAQEMEQEGRARYNLAGKLLIGRDWKFDLAFRRELSGYERVVYRSVKYQPDNKPISSITIGNFSTRYGLGTVVGYRGKLLDLARQIETESFIYPDYGGFNGILIEGTTGKTDWSLISSYQRDSLFGHYLVGGRTARQFESLIIGLTVGYNRINNKLSQVAINDFKVASDIRIEHNFGYVIVEPTIQTGQSSGNAIIIESKNHFEPASLFFALWNYSDQFLDLSSGSRSAQLSHSMEFDAIDFKYSSRRSGQQGMYWDGTYKFDEYELVQRSSIGRFSKDSLSLETLSGLAHSFSGVHIQLDHLFKLKRKLAGPEDQDKVSHRLRIEGSYSNSSISWRTYGALTDRDYDNEYLSLFFRIGYAFENQKTLRLWLNLSQFNLDSYQTDYCYGYFEFGQSIGWRLRLNSKLSQSYSRSRTDHYITSASIELVSQW